MDQHVKPGPMQDFHFKELPPPSHMRAFLSSNTAAKGPVDVSPPNTARQPAHDSLYNNSVSVEHGATFSN